MGVVNTARIKKQIQRTGTSLCGNQWYRKTVKKFLRKLHWESEKCWDGVYREMAQSCGFPDRLCNTNNHRKRVGLPLIRKVSPKCRLYH